MTTEDDMLKPPPWFLLLLEGRAVFELGAFYQAQPWLRLAPKGDGHPVLVLPGFTAGDGSTRPMRRFLKSRGYAVHGWGMGRNLGPNHELKQALLDRIRNLHKIHRQKVSLVGWSLGGIFARELARDIPEHVRSVITMGSPFARSPKANHAWRSYEAANPGSDRGMIEDELRERFARMQIAPPVPTTAIYSPTDGITAWQCCVERPGPQVENIEVEGSHCGLGHNPLVLYAVADRLAQPRGRWKPFERRGLKRLLYRSPRAAKLAYAF